MSADGRKGVTVRQCDGVMVAGCEGIGPYIVRDKGGVLYKLVHRDGKALQPRLVAREEVEGSVWSGRGVSGRTEDKGK